MHNPKCKTLLLATFLTFGLISLFGQQPDSTVYPVDALEVKPLFEGKGSDTTIFRFLARNIRLPMSVRNKVGSIGTAYINFIIDAKGEIDTSSVRLLFFKTGINDYDKTVKTIINESKLDPIQTDCVIEAKRVVRLLKNWTPGKVGEKGVKCTMSLPISFKNEGIIYKKG